MLQETVIYRLCIRNDGYAWGPQNLTKKFAHRVDLFGQLLFRNHVSKIFKFEHHSLN